MKNTLTLLTLFLATCATSMGEIVVNDYLSFEGFVDMSYAHQNKSINPSGAPKDKETDNSFSIDQVEISWLFNFDPVSARLDIEHEEGGDALEVEQAFVTFDYEGKLEGSALTAGRYASMLGFEAYEPTGLYQYSTAYGGGTLSNLFASAINTSVAIGSFSSDTPIFFESILFPVGERYSQGVRYTFEEDSTFFGFSIQDGTINYDGRLGGDNDTDGTDVDDGGYGFEIAYKYKCAYGLSFFLGGSYETGNGITSPTQTTEDTETYILNTYTTLELGAWLFAAEFNFSETELDAVSTLAGLGTEIESVTSLIMANYTYSENASITGRISYMELDNSIKGGSGDYLNANIFKYTAAYNYAFMDNILFVTELSYSEGKYKASSAKGDLNELLAAAEIIFTF